MTSLSQPQGGRSITSGAPIPLGYAVKARVPLFSAEAWSPLKVALFRSLYIATSIAQIGIWAREAGSPWLMHVLTKGWWNTDDKVAQVLAFSNLPICLFSVFAGALADVLDRRRLLIWTNLWMLVVSSLLGVFTWAGYISVGRLLAMTFLLGLGTTAMGPALQGLLPELVPAKDMALAINLNSVALNFARAAGPASFVVVVLVFSGGARGDFHAVAASYFLSAVSFVAAVWVLWRWKRAPQKAALHGEEMWNAIAFGFRYTVWSPANRAILLRVLTFIVPAVVLWAQVPTIAIKLLNIAPAKVHEYYALLFAFIGVGAILGVLLMPGLHKRYKIDPVVNVCTLLFAGGLIVLSFVHSLWLASYVMVFLGVNWVIIPTNFNTATQKSVPIWVKGRAISFYLTVLFGSFAIGGAIWGKITTATSIHDSLLIGGVSMAALLVLARWFPLTLNEGMDLSPAFKMTPGEPVNAPALAGLDMPADLSSRYGGLTISIDYQVRPEQEREFLGIMRRVGMQRRRNGAMSWHLRKVGTATLPTNGDGRIIRRLAYCEKFAFSSGEAHSRQARRMTKADLALLDEALAFHCGQTPVLRHEAVEIPTLRTRAQKGLGDTLFQTTYRGLEELEKVLNRFNAPNNRDPLRR